MFNPQCIVKLSWIKHKNNRFQARFVVSNEKAGILCNENFIPIHSPQKDVELIRRVTITINSIYTVYQLLLLSRFAYNREAVKLKDYKSLLIPLKIDTSIENIQSYKEVDQTIKESFHLKDTEWVLMDDLFQYTLPDFKGDANSPGREVTSRDNIGIKEYCDYLINVLKGGFGKDKKLSATIYNETNGAKLPFRLVALHLDHEFSEEMYKIESIKIESLWSKLFELNTKAEKNKQGISYNRIFILYGTEKIKNKNIPTVYIAKPDQKKYWLRSIGLRDGDSIYSDIMLMGNQYGK